MTHLTTFLGCLLISVLLLGVTKAESSLNTKSLVGKWIQAYHTATDGVSNQTLKVTWSEDGTYCLFKMEVRDGWKFMRCSTTTGLTTTAFDHQQLADRLKEQLNKKIWANKLPLDNFVLAGGVLKFRLQKTPYFYDLAANKLVPIDSPPAQKKRAPHPSKNLSPDGIWSAFIKGGSVFLKQIDGGQITCVGKPDAKEHYYEGTPKWNTRSTHFMVYHNEPGQRRMVSIVESSPKDSTQPKVHRFRYDKPGDKIDRREPRTFSIDGKTCHQPDPELTKNAFKINVAAWGPDGEELIYEYIERGFGKHYLISRNAATGKERLLAKEESDTFIYVDKVHFRKDLLKTGEIIWASERDGWRHLYLLDSKTGKVKNRITQGDWLVRGKPTIDTTTRSIIFSASGKNKPEDPYHLHWYKVNFDGSGLTSLTKADGNHSIQFSPNKKFYVDTWSRIDHPPVHELRRLSDGKLISVLAKADASGLLKQGRALPQRFVCKDRNGRFDIWGAIFTPPNYDPSKKYPVIENIYAGPHGAFVPKNFAPWISHINELTEEGFIVVSIDGLGTNFRHRDFSHFSYKNLVDAGLPDRIKWIKAAAEKYPWMDISRVGIYGGSAGGQSSTGAVLHHGTFYKAAASDCGCHDNRMDKIWWNEQWMDWPVGKHYAEQSNITNAHKLTGNLMLTVGEIDKNVDPASTTQLVAALMKADKDFEYYVQPSGGHGSGEVAYLRRKRFEFFKRHLGSAR